MAHCTQATISFPPLKQRQVEAGFLGSHISSNDGVLLLRQVDNRLRLSAAVAWYGERKLYLNDVPVDRRRLEYQQQTRHRTPYPATRY